MRQLCFVSLACLLFGAQGAEGGIGDKVTTIFNSFPGVIERKSLAFFSHFGANLNRNRKDGRLDCDYDDPAKRHMCPPIPASPFPPAPASASSFTKEKVSASVVPTDGKSSAADKDFSKKGDSGLVPEGDKTKSIPADLIAKCLDNPDDPDCALLEEEEKEAEKGSTEVVAPVQVRRCGFSRQRRCSHLAPLIVLFELLVSVSALHRYDESQMWTAPLS